MSRPVSRARRFGALSGASAATAGVMLALDLTWLGVVMRGVYDQALGPLKRPDPVLPAAGLFYVMYVGATVIYAVRGADTPVAAARRGAGLGFVAYATYELTNWAVLRDWPASLVPIDLGWGVALTSVSALVGKLAYDKLGGSAE